MKLIIMETKVCICCKNEKDLNDFSENKNKCKICINEYNRNNYIQNKEKRRSNYKERYNKNKDNILEKKKQYRKENKERLSTKHKPKEWKDKRSDYIKKYYQENKEKILNQVKEYRENNKEILKKYRNDRKEQIKENNKRWRENNKDIIQEWREANRDKINEYSRNWIKSNKSKHLENQRNHYHKNNYIFAWRSLLKRVIRQFGTKKEDKTINILGYSSLEFKEYIEKLFTPGMSWENYGEWHIDHIKTVSSFDKDTHPSIINSLTNLRPLWATNKEIDGIFYEGNLNRPKSSC